MTSSREWRIGEARTQGVREDVGYVSLEVAGGAKAWREEALGSRK